MSVRSMTKEEIWEWYLKSNKVILDKYNVGHTILEVNSNSSKNFIKISNSNWITYHDLVYDYTMSNNCPFVVDDYTQSEDSKLLDRIQNRIIRHGVKVYNRSNRLFANIISINRDTKQITVRYLDDQSFKIIPLKEFIAYFIDNNFNLFCDGDLTL